MPKLQTPDGDLQVYRIKITILDIEPPIWRRVDIPGNSPLDELHYVIQGIFQWDNSHLHEFHTPRGDFASTMLVDFMDENPDVQASEDIMLSEIFAGGTRRIRYWYDFGDDWMHDITLEKRMKPEPGAKYPIVVEGAGAGPPEDCGGPFGYMGLLEIAEKGPQNEFQREMLGWLGKSFDPAKFDLAACNRRLGKSCKPAVLVRATKKKGAGSSVKKAGKGAGRKQK